MMRSGKHTPRLARAVVLAGLAAVASAQRAPAQTSATAEPARPLWAAGLVAGGGRIPDYPGAGQAHQRAVVFPYVQYRGPVLSIDERGIRSRFLDTVHWDLDLSATAAFNTRNNGLREGMPPLDYLFGIGPQLVYKGWQSADGRGASVHLKLRAIQSTDFKRIDSRGATFTTELRWRWPGPTSPGSELTASIEPTWASRPLQRYFYEVGAAQATAARPAYDARAGYLGTDLTLMLRQRLGRELSWYVAADLTALQGAANRASPLLASQTNLAVGAWLVWTPWRSHRSAAD